MMLFIEIGRHDSPLSTPFRYGGGHRASIGSGAQFRDMMTLMFKFWAAIGMSWIWMYLLYKGDASHESRGLHQRNKKKKRGGFNKDEDTEREIGSCLRQRVEL